MVTPTVFLLSWDITGLEAVVNVSAIEKEKTWAILSDNKDSSPNLNSIVTAILMRARANTQRHYEVYTIQVDPSIDEDALRQMFEDSPQYAADLIRERGNKLYSDRVKQTEVRIV
jgi:predicted peptidase